MPQTITRVVGSGFTTFNYNGQPIAWLEGFTDSGQPAEPAPQPIYPLGSHFPAEFATSRVVREGQLTMTIREIWNVPVWQTLLGLAGTGSGGLPPTIEVYNAIAANPTAISCQMTINRPDGTIRGKIYHNVFLIGIDDTEQVQNGALTIARNLTALYTNYTLF